MSAESDTLIGYVSLLVSCIAFGLMFAPLKKCDCRDGFYIQWVQCAVVLLFGFVINIIRGMPTFNLVAAIGGLLYATGNIASVPIVSNIGIGPGMLIWGSIQITVGWCVARFGLFGTHPQPVQHELMNYLGVFATLLSGAIFLFVNGNTEQPPVSSGANAEDKDVRLDALPSNSEATTDLPSQRSPGGVTGIPSKKKLFFLGLSAALGILHGLMMTPIVWVQDNDPNHSDNVLDYVFSHFSTVFAFSTLYFFAYAAFKRGRPYAPPELVLPSVAYGVLWSIGMTLWIVSNRLLSQTVSFPITARLPAIIGALTDVLVFRTIKGSRNLCMLFAGIAVGVTGVVLVALSNQTL